jgi:hypothetical protein
VNCSVVVTSYNTTKKNAFDILHEYALRTASIVFFSHYDILWYPHSLIRQKSCPPSDLFAIATCLRQQLTTYNLLAIFACDLLETTISCSLDATVIFAVIRLHLLANANIY